MTAKAMQAAIFEGLMMGSREIESAPGQWIFFDETLDRGLAAIPWPSHDDNVAWGGRAARP
jgi:hypothetical protein